MGAYRGAHPAIGALDVCPLVWLDPGRPRRRAHRGARRRRADRRPRRPGLPLRRAGARAGAGRARLLPQRRPGRAVAADGGGGAAPRLRARPCRTPAPARLWSPPARRSPPSTSSSTAATSRLARAVAAGLRESGGGLPGVRAIGLALSSGRAQVSTNVHDPLAVPLAEVVERVRRAGGPARRPPARGRAGRPGPRRRARRLSGGRADPRLRPRAPRDRAPARRRPGTARPQLSAADHLDSGHGPDQEEAPAQAPRHPGRPHRHQAALRAPAAAPRRNPAPAPNASPRPKADLPPTWRSSAIRGIGRRRHLRDPPAGDLQTPARQRARASAPSCSSSTSPPATTST